MRATRHKGPSGRVRWLLRVRSAGDVVDSAPLFSSVFVAVSVLRVCIVFELCRALLKGTPTFYIYPN